MVPGWPEIITQSKLWAPVGLPRANNCVETVVPSWVVEALLIASQSGMPAAFQVLFVFYAETLL